MGAAPRVKHGAAAAIAVGVNEIGDRRVNAGLSERRDNEIALPRALGCGLPMLQGAAAAGTEMRADRGNACETGFVDVEEEPPVRMTGPVFDFSKLARQRARHVNRAICTICRTIGHAVAALADAIDPKMLDHGA